MKKYIMLIFTLFCLCLSGTPSYAQPTDSLIDQKIQHYSTIEEQEEGGSSGFITKTYEKIDQKLNNIIQGVKTGHSLKTIIAGVIFAFLLGVFHALGPGYGKSVVFSYFLSNQESPWKAPKMGLQLALTHVLSGGLLIFLGNLSVKYFISDPYSQVFWLKLISYSMITVIGVYMLSLKIKKDKQCCSCGCSHNIAHASSGSLAFSAGLIPCPCTMLILLYALANDVLWFGILLVVFKGIGIALTLSSAGLIAYLVREKLDKVMAGSNKYSFFALIEYVGPVFIILLGSFKLTSFFIG